MLEHNSLQCLPTPATAPVCIMATKLSQRHAVFAVCQNSLDPAAQEIVGELDVKPNRTGNSAKYKRQLLRQRSMNKGEKQLCFLVDSEYF